MATRPRWFKATTERGCLGLASGGLGRGQGQRQWACVLATPRLVCLGEFSSQTHLIAKKLILPLRVVQSVKMKGK